VEVGEEELRDRETQAGRKQGRHHFQRALKPAHGHAQPGGDEEGKQGQLAPGD